MKKITLIAIYTLLGYCSYSQTIIGGAGVIQIDGNPNSAASNSAIRTQGTSISKIAVDTANAKIYWYKSTQAFGSKWTELIPGTATDGYVLTYNATQKNWIATAPGGGGDMLLGTAQVVTANKTFNQGTLRVNGGSTWNGNFTSTLTSADRTWTMPDATGTVALTSSNITGSAGSVANNVTFSNSGTGAASGTTFNGSSAVTISHNSIGASPLAGSASLTTVGTITSGTWNGTTIAIANGGTGATSKAAAFDALSPMTTSGDIVYGGTSGTGTRLAGNTTTTKQFLTQTGTGSASAAPTWGTISGTDVTYASQTAGTVFAAPSGAAGTPSFRALVASDIPTLNQNTTGTAANITATSNTTLTTLSNLISVGTITTGTWSGSFGAVSGANLTSLTAGNLSGTIPSTVLGNSTVFVGTTSIALNRASANQGLTGISSVAIPGATSGTVTISQATTGTYTASMPTGNLANGYIDVIPTTYYADDSAATTNSVAAGQTYRLAANNPYGLPIGTLRVRQ